MILKYNLELGAVPPVKAHKDDLGVDLRCREGFTVPAKGSVTVDTGVTIQVPELDMPGFMTGCFVYSKSGLSVKSNIEKGAGVIDPNYTGTLKIHLYNHGKEDKWFDAGDKICQLVFMVCLQITSLKWDACVGDRKTERGKNGFGSTGK